MFIKHILYLTALLALGPGADGASAQVSYGANSYPVGYSPTCVTVMDVNNDGKLDLVSANSDVLGSGQTLTVLTNDGRGGFEFSATLPAGENPTCVLGADVNGDGKMDIISANAGDNTLTILTNDGSGGFDASATIPAGNTRGQYPFGIAAADLNGDGKPDLVVANFFGNTLTVFTNDGSGNFSSNATLTVGGNPAFVAVVDVNGDGKPDLISVNSESPPEGNTLSIYTNNGEGVFGSNATVYAGPNPRAVVAIDINGVGRPDLVVANDNPNWLTVLTNNGSGGFGSNMTLSVEGYAPSVTTVDVDGDGRPDLICANIGSTNTVEILTNNGSGGFGFNTSFVVGKNPVWVAAADLNGDGRPDLVTANYNTEENDSGTLTVLLNTSVFPSPASTPMLKLAPAGNGMTVSWPSASPGWSLQQSPSLIAPQWMPSSYDEHGISDNGTNKSLNIMLPAGNLFFRLAHP